MSSSKMPSSGLSTPNLFFSTSTPSSSSSYKPTTSAPIPWPRRKFLPESTSQLSHSPYLPSRTANPRSHPPNNNNNNNNSPYLNPTAKSRPSSDFSYVGSYTGSRPSTSDGSPTQHHNHLGSSDVFLASASTLTLTRVLNGGRSVGSSVAGGNDNSTATEVCLVDTAQRMGLKGQAPLRRKQVVETDIAVEVHLRQQQQRQQQEQQFQSQSLQQQNLPHTRPRPRPRSRSRSRSRPRSIVGSSKVLHHNRQRQAHPPISGQLLSLQQAQIQIQTQIRTQTQQRYRQRQQQIQGQIQGQAQAQAGQRRPLRHVQNLPGRSESVKGDGKGKGKGKGKVYSGLPLQARLRAKMGANHFSSPKPEPKPKLKTDTSVRYGGTLDAVTSSYPTSTSVPVSTLTPASTFTTTSTTDIASPNPKPKAGLSERIAQLGSALRLRAGVQPPLPLPLPLAPPTQTQTHPNVHARSFSENDGARKQKDSTVDYDPTERIRHSDDGIFIPPTTHSYPYSNAQVDTPTLTPTPSSTHKPMLSLSLPSNPFSNLKRIASLTAHRTGSLRLRDRGGAGAGGGGGGIKYVNPTTISRPIRTNCPNLAEWNNPPPSQEQGHHTRTTSGGGPPPSRPPRPEERTMIVTRMMIDAAAAAASAGAASIGATGLYTQPTTCEGCSSPLISSISPSASLVALTPVSVSPPQKERPVGLRRMSTVAEVPTPTTPSQTDGQAEGPLLPVALISSSESLPALQSAPSPAVWLKAVKQTPRPDLQIPQIQTRMDAQIQIQIQQPQLFVHKADRSAFPPRGSSLRAKPAHTPIQSPVHSPSVDQGQAQAQAQAQAPSAPAPNPAVPISTPAQEAESARSSSSSTYSSLSAGFSVLRTHSSSASSSSVDSCSARHQQQDQNKGLPSPGLSRSPSPPPELPHRQRRRVGQVPRPAPAPAPVPPVSIRDIAHPSLYFNDDFYNDDEIDRVLSLYQSFDVHQDQFQDQFNHRDGQKHSRNQSNFLRQPLSQKSLSRYQNQNQNQNRNRNQDYYNQVRPRNRHPVLDVLLPQGYDHPGIPRSDSDTYPIHILDDKVENIKKGDRKKGGVAAPPSIPPRPVVRRVGSLKMPESTSSSLTRPVRGPINGPSKGYTVWGPTNSPISSLAPAGLSIFTKMINPNTPTLPNIRSRTPIPRTTKVSSGTATIVHPQPRQMARICSLVGSFLVDSDGEDGCRDSDVEDGGGGGSSRDVRDAADFGNPDVGDSEIDTSMNTQIEDVQADNNNNNTIYSHSADFAESIGWMGGWDDARMY